MIYRTRAFQVRGTFEGIVHVSRIVNVWNYQCQDCAHLNPLVMIQDIDNIHMISINQASCKHLAECSPELFNSLSEAYLSQE